MIGTLLWGFGYCKRYSKKNNNKKPGNVQPLRPIPKGDTLRRWRFYKLGHWQKLAYRTTWFVEGNSNEFTSSRNCYCLEVTAELSSWRGEMIKNLIDGISVFHILCPQPSNKVLIALPPQLFNDNLTHFWRWPENHGPDRNCELRFWFMWTPFQTYRRDVHPFEIDTKGRLFVVDISIN